MDLNQVIYTVFHAEFKSGSRIGPKPPQDLIFKDFVKIMIFIKIIFFYIDKGPLGAHVDASQNLNLRPDSNSA